MIEIAEEVRDALAEGAPVVALESTIIAHGLPYPENLKLGKALEAEIRSQGAVPATIAVVDGRACVGLDTAGLESLANPEIHFAKAGAADSSVVIAKKACAATTVSATSSLAAAAGIRLFATGGIGGVHRGDPSDVSADLLSLSRVPVAVVSAGPKAILDLPRTVEALESLAVLVLGYGCDELPASYCRDSGISLEHRVDSAQQAAEVLHTRWQLLDQGGVLVANPAPEEVAMPRELVEQWIEKAHAAAESAGISRKALTPFLLQFIAKVSGGDAVATNCALALNNAKVAAQIAAAYCNLV
ncbi:MAG: pseudouridine-5'-phosphate glycosidase [Kofleriaceae bacterium]|nr:pseudouridine-5'-phosphate glycosidase [Kofleriaceae bacterium]